MQGISRVVGAFLALAFAACAETEPQRTNVVLITVDTLRADRLSPYGYEAAETPAIESLARSGIVFENAFCEATWTLPSIASVMTGSYPGDHGVRRWVDRLAEDRTTLAELLREAGYQTAAVVGSVPLDARYGFDQGFDLYDDEMEEAVRRGQRESAPPDEWFDGSDKQRVAWFKARQTWGAYRTDDRVADRAIAWLDANQGAPFFLWVHFFGPHERDKPAQGEGRGRAWIDSQIERYDEWVGFTDQQVGRLLERLRGDPRGLETAVVFHSDHGQDLEEHGVFGHGATLYDSSARVPLIVALPEGRRAGERVESLVRNLDIFATIVGLARLDPVSTVGRDLLLARHGEDHTFLEGAEAPAGKLPVDGRKVRVRTSLRGIRTPEWKLVVTEPRAADAGPDRTALPAELVEKRRRFKLFDLDRDPGENENRAFQDLEKSKELFALLRAHGASARAEPAEAEELDSETRERLQSIGYLED